MDIKKEKRKLGNYLDKIDKIKESIIDSSESNLTELEILKNYLSKSLEEVILLNYKLEVNSSSSSAEQTISIPEDIVPPIPKVEKVESPPTPKVKEIVNKEEEVKSAIEEAPVGEIGEVGQTHGEIKNEAKEVIGSINDRLKTERREINSLSTFARSISDLISLNDRIAFTNELLKRDQSAYNELLKMIDNSASYDESLKYIQENVASKYDWNNDDQVVKQFYHLLDLKFK